MQYFRQIYDKQNNPAKTKSNEGQYKGRKAHKDQVNTISETRTRQGLNKGAW